MIVRVDPHSAPKSGARIALHAKEDSMLLFDSESGARITGVSRPVRSSPRRCAARRRFLRLTELSLGCAQLGNLYRAIPDTQAYATVEAAWEQDIRYFDTAPHYGLGLSERRLGSALTGRARSDYVVSTKVGRRLEPLSPPGQIDDGGFEVAATHRRVWDFSRDGVLRSLEESLQRLGLDSR